MEAKIVKNDDLEKVNVLVENCAESGFMQLDWWGQFKAQMGADVLRLMVEDKGQIVGYAQFLNYQFGPKANFFYLPEGPVLNYQSLEAAEIFSTLMRAFEQHVDRGQEKYTSHLRLQPRLKKVPEFFSAFKKASLNPEPKTTLIIDLLKTKSQLLSEMKPKGRYNIGLAERHGVEVVADLNEDFLEKFYHLYQQTIVRNHEAPLGRNYFDRLLPILKKHQKGKIFLANYKGKSLSAALVIYCGKTATYFHGGSILENKEVMASNVLHWNIIKDSKAQGLERYDFRGLVAVDDEKHPWFGFSSFKRKFGGQEEKYIGAFDLVFNEELYQKHRF